MKKALSAIIALLIAFLLLSCNGQIQNKGEDNGPSQEPEYIEPPVWDEKPEENTEGSWVISSTRLDTEAIMMASTDTLITKTTTDENVSVEQTEGGGKVITVTKDITQDGVTILKDSKVTFTPKSQAAPASRAIHDTEYEIVADIKAKITSTSDSSGSTTQAKELNVSYSATTSNIETLENIKTTEIKATTAEGDELYTSTSTPTALLVKSYDQQIDDMILAFIKGNPVSGFDVDENRSFYSMGKGWIYFISYADKEYHKVNFSISKDGKIESRTLDGWCEGSGEEGLKVSEHPAVKDEDTEMPLSDQDIIDLTAQLYAYFIRYIPMKYGLYLGGDFSLPNGITSPSGKGDLKFSSFKEKEFFDEEITINGEITNSNYVISADLKNFPVKEGKYNVRIGGVADENNSYVGGQATHAYISTADGKEYSYNYLVDEIYKVCIRVFATARMAGLPIIRQFESMTEHEGGGVISLIDTYYEGNQGLVYNGTINFSFTNKTFDASFHINDTSSSLAQDVDFTGEGTISDDYKMINWTEANLEYFGECSDFELKIINKLMEVEFSAIKK